MVDAVPLTPLDDDVVLMNPTVPSFRETPPRPALFRPPISESNSAPWRINGHGATITIWTVEEWDRLVERPTDAQYYPSGVWCALRMD